MTENEHTCQPYDSRPETLLHSLRVGALMTDMLTEGMRRAVEHDLSKTRPPELEAFDRVTPILKTLAYGSDAYEESRESIADALDHHYTHNRHHPEHHENGIRGMTLVDLMEMIADWRASTERMAPGTGDLRVSIINNMKRFGYGDDVACILLATAEHFGWLAPAGDNPAGEGAS